MQAGPWLKNSTKKLKSSGDTAQLDAEVLLADALHRDRSWLHAHPEFVLTKSILAKLDHQIKRRLNSEPLAYIRGQQEFFGREFFVSKDTLTPRPESEAIVHFLIDNIAKFESADGNPMQIIDVGTGSGCIIISAAIELSKNNKKQKLEYLGLDISRPALKIARQNTSKLNQKVKFYYFDVVKSKISKFDRENADQIFLANLPYVPNGHTINEAAKHEPKIAIFGGTDGLDYYRALFAQLESTVKCIVTESFHSQHKKLSEIAVENGFSRSHTNDFIQAFTRPS